MVKNIIIVPKGIKYISDWEKMEGGYNLEDYNFPHILNKEITGCGYTEYCIKNNQNLVLLSPRKMLLQNKEDQHKGDVYYAKNELGFEADYERDISIVSVKRFGGISSLIKSDKQKEEEARKQEELKESIKRYKDRVRNYIDNAQYEGKPIKILVTYDSFRHIKDVLKELGMLEKFQVVVDEFQSVLIDSRFKSDTELELLYLLQDIQKVCFVSATPLLDKYLEMLDEFKNLPYFSLDWESEDPGRIINPTIETRYTVRGLNEEISKIIKPYLDNRFDKRIKYDNEGKPYEVVSNEAVLYVNSVKSICRAIINNKLTPGQCNILCAQTEENNKVVKAAFNSVLGELGMEKVKRGKENWVLGSIPKKGEPHKMFTFCTRTVYLGADFYSTCARTFIFSDSNIECLSVDVSMDLEQILGRQRLEENPWKNYAFIVIKTTTEIRTKEDFDNYIKKKVAKTNNILASYDEARQELRQDMAEKYERDQKNSCYKYDYAGFRYHAGKDKYPVFNNIVCVAEQRAFDIQQVDYKDRFTVFNAMKETGFEVCGDNKILDYVDKFRSLVLFPDKIKYIYLIDTELLSGNDFTRFLSLIPPKFGEYIKLLGYSKLKALRYSEADIIRECSRVINNFGLEDQVKEVIYANLKIGERYSCSDIKQKLRTIYNSLGYKKTPKATDLKDYFELKDVILVVSGKRIKAFEILSIKI